MRLFFAFPLPDEPRRALAGHMEELRALVPARWVSAGNLHVTLRFLGEISAPEAQRLSRILRESPAAFPAAFSVYTAGLGAFRSGRSHTLWMGLREHPALTEAHRALTALLAQAGYPPESRRFTPHITLARDAVLARSLDAATRDARPFPPMPVPIGAVTLYESRLSPGGALYRPLAVRAL